MRSLVCKLLWHKWKLFIIRSGGAVVSVERECLICHKEQLLYSNGPHAAFRHLGQEYK